MSAIAECRRFLAGPEEPVIRKFILRVYGVPMAYRGPSVKVLAGGRPLFYDRSRQREWKVTVRAQAAAQEPEKPIAGPVRLWLRFHLPRPRSLPKKVRRHMTRPDWVNIVKQTEDALKGIIIVDDGQVVEAHVWKAYGDQPGVEIVVEELEP